MYEKLHIGVSPITGRIYLGRLSKPDRWADGKRDVTEMVIRAMFEHLLTVCKDGRTGYTIEGVGRIKWVPEEDKSE